MQSKTFVFCFFLNFNTYCSIKSSRALGVTYVTFFVRSLRKVGKLQHQSSELWTSKSFGLKSLNPVTVWVNSLFCVSWWGDYPLCWKCQLWRNVDRASAELLLTSAGPLTNSKLLDVQSMKECLKTTKSGGMGSDPHDSVFPWACVWTVLWFFCLT